MKLRPIERTPTEIAGRSGTALVSKPITVPCRGSWHRATKIVVTDYGQAAICPDCGERVAIVDKKRCAHHDRDDILAMITRGDYGRL